MAEIDEASFSVVTSRTVCTSTQCFMTVTITNHMKEYRLTNNDGVFSLQIDNTNATLPVAKPGLQIRELSSRLIQFVTDEGIQVIWDGITRVNLEVPSKYKGKIKGMAGNFNSKTTDEYLTPYSDLSHSAIDFGNSWMAVSQGCTELAVDTEMTACQANHQNVLKAEQSCNVLKNHSSVFSSCQSLVDPTTYYANCKEDVCGCESTDGICLCAVLSAYARECGKKGGRTDGWREGTICGKT